MKMGKERLTGEGGGGGSTERGKWSLFGGNVREEEREDKAWWRRWRLD